MESPTVFDRQIKTHLKYNFQLVVCLPLIENCNIHCILLFFLRHATSLVFNCDFFLSYGYLHHSITVVHVYTSTLSWVGEDEVEEFSACLREEAGPSSTVRTRWANFREHTDSIILLSSGDTWKSKGIRKRFIALRHFYL